MGTGWSRPKSNYRIIMIGLDHSGKTTLLLYLKNKAFYNTLPTLGFNVEQVDIDKKTQWMVWDISGKDNYRPLWHNYFNQMNYHI